jgi:hypothetical protein
VTWFLRPVSFAGLNSWQAHSLPAGQRAAHPCRKVREMASQPGFRSPAESPISPRESMNNRNRHCEAQSSVAIHVPLVWRQCLAIAAPSNAQYGLPLRGTWPRSAPAEPLPRKVVGTHFPGRASLPYPLSKKSHVTLCRTRFFRLCRIHTDMGNINSFSDGTIGFCGGLSSCSTAH